jgi:hypothetical protein
MLYCYVSSHLVMPARGGTYMARDPSQEDVPENPQYTGAQNGCSVLESSHGSVIWGAATRRQFTQRRARVEAGLGKMEAFETFDLEAKSS